MKRIINSILTFIIGTLFLIGCEAPSDNNNNKTVNLKQVGDLQDGYFRINFTGTTTPIGAWIWGDFDGSETSKCTAWGDKAFPLTGKNGDFFAFDIKLLESAGAVNFIILGDGWSKLAGEADITFKFPSKYKEVWVDVDGKVWVNAEQTKEAAGLVSASITGESEITIVLSEIKSVVPADFKVTDKDGKEIAVSAVTTTKLTIAATEYINKAPYTVIFRNEDRIIANIASSLLDSQFAYEGDDLGWHNGVAKVWAPLATKAEILIYDDMATAKADFGDPENEISAPETPSVAPVAMTNAGNGFGVLKYLKVNTICIN